MKAQVLYIEDKVRKAELELTSLGDFRYRPGTSIDARTLLHQPHVSLYCLDDQHGQAVFTEAAPGVDVSRGPFMYRTQYSTAQRLLTVDYGTFHDLADAAGDRFQSLIPMYTVGRCGGTVLSRAMSRLDHVLSLDEPDVYNSIVLLRARNGRRDAELVRLLRSSTRLLHNPPPGKNPDTLFLKFRAFPIEVGDLMHKAFPQARNLFLYRNAEAWLRSAGRLAQSVLETPDASATLGSFTKFIRRMDASRQSPTARAKGEKNKDGRGAALSEIEQAMRCTPLVPAYIKRTLRRRLGVFGLARLGLLAAGQKVPILRDRLQDPLEFVHPHISAIPSIKLLALLWLSTMHRYLALHAQGIPILAIRYETLVSNSRSALEAVFDYCGLPREQVSVAVGAFGEDSQKDTLLARDRLRVQDSDLAPDLLLQLHEILAEHPPTVTADFIAPNSLELPFTRGVSVGTAG